MTPMTLMTMNCRGSLNGGGHLICITTPATYHGAHETFYLPPWQRRASRWNFSGRAWGCLCVEGKCGGRNTRADRITEKTLLKGLLCKGVTRYGFPTFRPRSLAGQLGVERRPGPSQYTRIGPAHRPARVRAILARRAPQLAQRRQLRARGDDWARGEGDIPHPSRGRGDHASQPR